MIGRAVGIFAGVKSAVAKNVLDAGDGGRDRLGGEIYSGIKTVQGGYSDGRVGGLGGRSSHNRGGDAAGIRQGVIRLGSALLFGIAS